MVTSISHSPAETEAVGESWGCVAGPGLVIGLCGDLGAGKTQLVKGLARGLGIPLRVHSPTFALVNIYPGGRLKLTHLDLYRLDTLEQIITAGLEEYLHPQGVTAIEWAEKIQNFMSAIHGPQPTVHSPQATVQRPRGIRLRWVNIEVLSETERRISYEDIGA